MAARAANVSAQLKAAGFALTNPQRWYQGGPGIRVSQVSSEVRVQVRATEVGQVQDILAMLTAVLCDLGYKVNTNADTDNNRLYIALWVGREDTSESKTAG